ncbi:hypothetical protein XI09_33225 [Bradyrhizobium sp. CCBAU 11386]|nr:hypothetical protein [Bradyrhizobium sp. CCBAU 11386]
MTSPHLSDSLLSSSGLSRARRTRLEADFGELADRVGFLQHGIEGSVDLGVDAVRHGWRAVEREPSLDPDS